MTDSNRNEVNTSDEQIDKLELEKIELENEIDELKAANDRLYNDIKTIDRKINSINAEIEKNGSNGRLNIELEELHSERNELIQVKEKNSNKLSELDNRLQELTYNISELKSGSSKSSNKIGTFIKKTAKKTAAAPFKLTSNVVKNSVKSFGEKINPFDKKLNKNDVSDTGTESMKLAYRSVKKGKNTVKSVNRTVKTTKRTIKTTANVVTSSGKIIYKSAEFTVKAAATTVKATITVATHVIALALNPFSLIAIGALFIFVFLAESVIILLGGGAGGSTTNGQAQASAAGLGDVPAQYQEAIGFFDTAIENKRNDFCGIIDSLYYDYNDLTYSDLAYMERTAADLSTTIYDKSFAVDSRKNDLKAAFDIQLTEREAIAIAYVYLEKQKNDENGTQGGIYEVTYTQEVFDEIVAECIRYTDTVYSGQLCPDQNCTLHQIDNPEYQTALDNYNRITNAYNEWVGMIAYFETHDSIQDGAAQSAYWENNIEWRITNWEGYYGITYTGGHSVSGAENFLNELGTEYENCSQILDNTPPTIDEYVCDYQHNLHSLGMWILTKEDVMNALGFTEADIQWEELTEQGFENNPNI